MPDRKWKRCQNVAHHRAVCLMHGGQNLGRMGGGRCHLCPLLSHRCLPPPDMSTLVKSWPYRELYGLIGAPFDGTGPDMSLWWSRGRHASKSQPGLHRFGQAFSFWGAAATPYHRIPTCKATTKRGGVVPKVNCRISGVGGRFEIT